MLTPSERVKLITEIARRLGEEQWPVVDLTLRQFSLPTDDDWRGDTTSYILNMVESADEDTLQALATHVGFSLERPSGIDPAFWAPGYLRLFASHISADKEYAYALQTALSRFGISTFVAHADIEPTKEWQDEIELALSTADALVALMTSGFHESKWTDQEIGFAMGRGLLIVSVRLGHDPYGFLGKFQGLNGTGIAQDETARRLFETLLQHKQTRARMKEGLVKLFEEANTFQEAKDRMTLLEGVSEWPEPLRTRIREAAHANNQIHDAFGVPERVTSLLGSRR